MSNDLDRAFYRETIRGSGLGEQKIIRPCERIGEYAHVRVSVHPRDRGQGIALAWNAGTNIPARFVAAVLQGVQAALDHGVLLGYEVTDLHASVESGSYHDADSNADVFREAAEKATLQAIREADPVLLEATLSVTISIPEEFAGHVQGTIASYGQIMEGMQVDAASVSITTSLSGSQATELIAYLLEWTEGRASFSVAVRNFVIKAEPPEPPGEWVAAT